MAGPIETLRKEGAVIKDAPWSFAIVTGIIAASLFGVFQWEYGAQIEHWKGLAEQNAPAHLRSFTATGIGCALTKVRGVGAAGSFTLAPGPCKAVRITMDSALAAPNGWHCNVSDKTSLAAGIYIPTWGEDASTGTTITIPIPAAAYQNLNSKGTTDVISFACRSY